MQNSVRHLLASDINDVVKVHCTIFPGSRSSRLGDRYVRKMFRWFIKYQPGLSYVSISDGKISGYVIGAVGGYGRKLFRYAFFEIAWGLISHPKLWFNRDIYNLWYSYLQAFNPVILYSEIKLHNNRASYRTVKASLSGIGVLPSMRGQGVGKLLLDTFENAALNQGAEQLGLSVEIRNKSARNLYEQNKWILDATNLDRSSAHYSKKLYKS